MTISFRDLGVSEEIIKAVGDMGFEEPSPIQEKAIPLVLNGVDMIGQAQTGTGKTAAFSIPIIEKIDAKEKKLQAMILCPTRELSIQVAEEISKLAKYKKGVRTIPVYGGQPIDRQIKALKSGVQIVVGTPGRVIDHINRKTIKTEAIKIFVLDEADEMFDMGFREDIELVIDRLPEDKQTTFFSATMAKEIMDFAQKYQKSPEIVKIVKKELTVPKVTQFYYDLDNHMKTEILSRVLDIYNPTLTVVFCNTKKMVDELTSSLRERGYLAEGLHGDLKQAQRDFVMNKFRKLTTDILVATDVAARGIDVDEVDMVINYDMPQDDEYYVHRIGRTARAGREGTAISFVSGKEFYKLRDIQKYTKTVITKKDIPTLVDIRNTQANKILNLLVENIGKEEEIKKHEKIVNIMLEENYSPIDIALSAIDLFVREKGLSNHEELDYIDNDKKRPQRGRDRERSRDRERRRDRSSKRKDENMARVFLSVGNLDGVGTRHILSSLLEYSGLNKKTIGKIDVYDKYSFIEVEKKHVKELIKKADGKTIKGRSISIEVAKPRKK